MASYGHVRDLIPKEGAVDTEHDFDMKYQLIDRNSKHVDAIVREMKKSDALFLATDPDREGEAISWHLCELLKERKALKDKPVHRIVFNAITKNAVNEAVEQPARPVQRTGQCPAGTACTRLPGGFQTVAVAVEKNTPRPVCRARAKPGIAHDRGT